MRNWGINSLEIPPKESKIISANSFLKYFFKTWMGFTFPEDMDYRKHNIILASIRQWILK